MIEKVNYGLVSAKHSLHFGQKITVVGGRAVDGMEALGEASLDLVQSEMRVTNGSMCDRS